MSYEKKMKDLLGRLVSMSPEPPPYPEEMQLATQPKSERRIHPALVFAGTAVLVAALAVPVILLTSGQDPVAGGTTTTTTTVGASTTQPQPSTTEAPTSTTVPATSTTVAPVSIWRGTIFLYQTPENSFVSNPALVPVEVEVTDPSTNIAQFPFTEALARMGDNLPPGLHNAIPAEVRIVALEQSGDLVVADMSESFLDGGGGLLGDVTMLNQIIYTLTQFDPAQMVQFTVNGEPVEAYGSEGLVLTDPVDRATFIDDYLDLIFLTEPIMEVENVYVVAGRSRTFEAMLSVRVIDSAGDTVHEERVQATCGSGCWGEFGVGVPSEQVTRGESSIQLFEYSAEDGMPSNVITIPILDSDVWSVTLG